MPVVQLDEDTIRNSLIESDDNSFARVEGVRMLKPTVKKGKVRSVQENGADDDETADGHEQGYNEVESVSSHHHHHHHRKTCWWCYSSPEDVKRVKKEARKLEGERERERRKGRRRGSQGA